MSGRALPERSTRGKRMRAAMEEEEEADSQFWNQEFFAEEANDDDYQEEEEQEDVPDSDFDEPEEEDDEEEGQEVDERPKRKVLKAPEPKKPKAPPKPKPKKEPKEEDEEEEEEEEGGSRQKRVKMEVQPELLPEYEVPTLRRSTVAKVAEAVDRRKAAEQVRPVKRPSKAAEVRMLSQKELLEEAALTEIHNTQSLKYLLAQEEATKKKAAIVKQNYTGPLVRLSSKRREVLATDDDVAEPAANTNQLTQPSTAANTAAGGQPSAANGTDQGTSEAMEVDKEEQKAKETEPKIKYEATLAYELHNMQGPPQWLRRMKAPPAPPPPLCIVTSTPAKYRDPATGFSFSSAAAYRRMKGLPSTRQSKPSSPSAPIQLSEAGFNGPSTVFPGASVRHTLSQAALRAAAALPPEEAPLPEPSPVFPLVSHANLPSQLMALLISIHRGHTGPLDKVQQTAAVAS